MGKIINKQNRIKLSSTNCSSNVLGACEVCGKQAISMYSKTGEKAIFNYITKRVGFTHLYITYGHYSCLIGSLKLAIN